MDKVTEIIENEIDNVNFSVDQLVPKWELPELNYSPN